MAKCYVGKYDDIPIAFVAVLPSMGHKGIKRESRIVVLPDYQGVGFGSAMSDGVAKLYIESGLRYTSTTSHPGMIRYRNKSDSWKITSISKNGKLQGKKRSSFSRKGTSFGRSVVSFEYVKGTGNKCRMIK